MREKAIMDEVRKFLSPNIDWRGRLARLIFAVVLIVAGLALRRRAWWACMALMIFGGLALFEAFRGWCLMRACGFKTKL